MTTKRYVVTPLWGKVLRTNNIRKVRRYLKKHLKKGISCEFVDEVAQYEAIYYAKGV